MSQEQHQGAAQKRGVFPGAVAAVVIVGLAYGVEALLVRLHVPQAPGVAILAILLGVVIANVAPIGRWTRPGCTFIMRQVLPIAIVLIGAGLDLTQLARPEIGLIGLLITVVCMAVAYTAGYALSRVLGLTSNAGVLMGIGTAVCGNSAIIAAAPVIAARDEEVALSLGAINLVGLLTMFAVPPIAQLAGLSLADAGILAGTTVHAVPQAVAAGLAVSDESGSLATLFKLVRVTMLAPAIVLISVMVARSARATADSADVRQPHFLRLVPWFVWGFVLTAALKSIGALDVLQWGSADSPQTLSSTLEWIGKLLLALSMAAVGLQVNLRELLHVGMRGVVAGVLAAVILVACSVILLRVLS